MHDVCPRYLREEFVVRRRWLDEQAYADLVGLCQFLFGIVLVGFLRLTVWRAPPLMVVIISALGGAALAAT